MNTPFPAKTPKGQRRNKALISAASEIFIQHGFEGTTLDMIIERAGGSRSTLYKNFGDKEGLFAAVIETMIDDIFSDYETTPPAPQTIESVLSFYGARFLLNVIKPQSIGLYRLILGEYNRFPEISQAFFEQGPVRSYRLLAEKLLELPEVKVNEKILLSISSRFLEMLKADVFITTFCVADFQPSDEFITQQISLSVDIIASYIRKISR
ncbi:TetR/AcrR family transcriptional regulator [Providencia manganoxydans]|uniref:TetR/AcrR family transcriptional regulator n=2 Tax=Providencia TaxID=586 RepID=A0AAI9DA88_PROST|nr:MULTISPECIES: TetR/AcrR family transcriptional regulator [Providencia]ELR5111876.1 TetR/AcrR family transcriptional regulator [Providencia stuartii]MDV5225802.1 TetR/AcrR family transcriptional regulator [Providencia rettgeri]MDX4944126.1 TetR/AcrR family transcriptional regulator [Providencia manganoxydans]QQO60911.1 TetR/AcrR family transcriptional regulator [Providencia manganoxydans]HEF8774383.1 TetR/AcrR family transcriptional regulator [Providencia stuartii]